MKTKHLYTSLCCFALIALSSCDKWLNVEPNSQIRSSDLFSNEAGFKEALAGIYTIMTNKNLYGKEIQYGTLGVISQEWSSYPLNYDEDAAYEYESTNAQSRINNIWNSMYQAISNTNNLINNIDAKKSIFNGDNYNIIKGEAYALRAFLHFELVRLFGASYMVDPNKPAIPYVTQYTPQQTAQSTVKETYDLIKKDLDIARELLKVDPILTGRIISEGDDNGYLINRQLHLNYYAVEALLARFYYYTNDLENARTAANTVINSEKFSYSIQSNLTGGIDLTGAPEHIFGLYINDQYVNTVEFLSPESREGFGFHLTDAASNVYYESNSSDYRYSYLFVPGLGSNATNYYLLKYSEPNIQTLYYRNKSVVIKLSEMYFILSGSNLAEGKSILTPINNVRQARGLTAITTEPANPTALMITEFRKEFFGEGQLFHLYKRLNRSTIAGTDKDLVATKAYIFPIPIPELEAANRSNNR